MGFGYSRAGLCQIQSFFRRSAFYGFWALNRCITNQLFNLNRRRRRYGRRGASSANETDPFVRRFGSAQPSSLPESTACRRHTPTRLVVSLSHWVKGGCSLDPV